MTTSSVLEPGCRETSSTQHHLVDLAARGLPQMLDPASGMFCYRLQRTPQGLMREGVSPRYTLITLMGLHRLQQAGLPVPISTAPIYERLIDKLAWIDNLGDLGLLWWLCALTRPNSLDQVACRIDPRTALARYPDARQGKTMELAWFLTGLSRWVLTQPKRISDLQEPAFNAYRMLRANQGASGIFAHQTRGKSLSGRFRWWAGSFADQVYPIYAITQFFKAWPNPGAQQAAINCARAICQAQGPLGQWWWHYDAASGAAPEVADPYPVFSVHQHGMAPMVLLELGEALQYDFRPWIDKGLAWIRAQNELSIDMEDADAGLIWRCICRSSMKRYWDAAFRHHSIPSDLRVVYECRPYELGWLLYAWAART